MCVDFYCNFFTGNGIEMVLHWQPPNLHTFNTDPSLIMVMSEYLFNIQLMTSVRRAEMCHSRFTQKTST